MNGLAIPAIAFVATILFIIALRPIALRLGLTDSPGARKVHEGDIPLVGGISIYLAILFTVGGAAIYYEGYIEPGIWAFFAAISLLVLVGAWDDLRGLSPLARFINQIAAALIMVYGAGVQLLDLGALRFDGSDLYLRDLALPFTVFVTVGVINAINMCDGLDGLSGNMTLVSFAGLGIANSIWGSPANIDLNIVSACIAGFLVFNQRSFWRHKAWVFLGDAGSMMLGLALVWSAIELTQGYPRTMSPAAALWFMAIPVYDTVTMMIRRVLSGRSPFQADAEHLHHMLVRAGLSVGETLGVMCLLAALCCGVGLLMVAFEVPDRAVLAVFIAVGALYLCTIQSVWRAGSLLGRPLREVGTGH